MLSEYQDYRVMAECGQKFEGLMPKAIDALGGIGNGEACVSVYAQGEGVSPMEVIDATGLAEA